MLFNVGLNLWHLLLSPGIGGICTGAGILVAFYHQSKERKRSLLNDENERWWQQYQQIRLDLPYLTEKDYKRASEALELALPQKKKSTGRDTAAVLRVMLEVLGVVYMDQFAGEDAPEVDQEEVDDGLASTEEGTL